MYARVRTSPMSATSAPPAPSRSTTSTGCRRTFWRPPTAHSAITVGWRQDRRPSVQARCSRRSRASNTTARGTCRTMCARSTACCATARAPRPTGSRCRRWPIPTAGIRPIRWRSARSTRASSAGSGRSIRPMAARRAGSRCRATGRNRASTGRPRSTPMRSTRRCGSTTISPIFSTIPSMATSSARWTGARSMASMPATPSMCASAASKRKPASDCRRAVMISVSACSRHCSARRSRPCARTVSGKAMSACGPIRRHAGPTGCAPRSASARIILREGC